MELETCLYTVYLYLHPNSKITVKCTVGIKTISLFFKWSMKSYWVLVFHLFCFVGIRLNSVFALSLKLRNILHRLWEGYFGSVHWFIQEINYEEHFALYNEDEICLLMFSILDHNETYVSEFKIKKYYNIIRLYLQQIKLTQRTILIV